MFTISNTPVDGEWIRTEDSNGRLLFEYSPRRDIIRIKHRDLTTEIPMSELRRQGIEKLLDCKSPAAKS